MPHRTRSFFRSAAAPAVVLALAAVLAPRDARAQASYRLAPVGGRSTLLGGTGVVYGRDAAAAFLNPATAVLADDDRLSFSANFYTVSFVYAPRWYEPGPVNQERFGGLGLPSRALYDLEFKALPSSLCVIFRAGQVKMLARDAKDPKIKAARLGLCFATIQEQSFDFAAEGVGAVGEGRVTRQAQSLSQSYLRFAAGPTYAMNVSDTVAIGASLHGSLASHRSLLTATTSTYGSGSSPFSTSFYSGSRGDAFQLEALVGATWRVTKKQTVGASIRLPSIHVFGVGGANRTASYASGDGETASSLVSATGSFVSRSPMRVSLGTGIETSWGNAELNVAAHLPTTAYSAQLEGEGVDISGMNAADRSFRETLSERARGVVNVAVGAEVFVSPRVGMLGGVFTDVSAVRGEPRGSLFNYFPSRTDRVGGSLGVASHGEGGELMVGGEVSVGWGKRLAVSSFEVPPSISTTGHGTYQLMLVIAGSTSLKNITRAVKDVKNVFAEPKPNPNSPLTPQPGAAGAGTPRVEPKAGGKGAAPATTPGGKPGAAKTAPGTNAAASGAGGADAPAKDERAVPNPTSPPPEVTHDDAPLGGDDDAADAGAKDGGRPPPPTAPKPPSPRRP